MATRSLEMSLRSRQNVQAERPRAALPRRSSAIVVRAAAAGDSGSTSSNNNNNKNTLPDKGFFADVDPKAEVYPVRSGLNQDLTKRSGNRWASDFVWNSDVKKALDFQDSVRRQAEEKAQEQQRTNGNNANDGKGFLSLTSKVDLNSMDVDLSAQLKPRKKPQASNNQQRKRKSSSGGGGGSTAASLRQLQIQQSQQLQQQRASGYASIPSTRGEIRTWDRSGRYSRRGPVVAGPDDIDEEALAKLKEERERYDALKQELQAWAAGLAAFGFASTFVFYGRDVAASYAVGALGGLLYLRLLNKSIDGFAVGGLGAALGQPRLLIPVILALGYNRYNVMVADETGLTLQLLPMLVGFFTYKLAAVGRESLALFAELTESMQSENKMDNGNGNGGDDDGDNDGSSSSSLSAEDKMDVRSVDRAFRKKIMTS